MSTELSSIAVETLAAAEDPVETANAPDSLVASSLCSSRTDTVEEETCHPSSTQGESQVTNPSSDKTCKEHDAKASPEDTIECPYPIDVLMPVSGYQLWNGNRRYRMLVEHHLPAFQASASNTQEQAKIALDIVHTIQREGGRFLQAIDTPVEDSNGKGILCTTVWKILPETDILVALGDILRDERGQARKRRRHQRKERRRERREARRALMEQQQQSKVEGEAPMVGGVAGCSALRSLFYVPTMDCEDYTSTSSSSTASDGNVIKGPPAKKKARQSPVKKANSNKKYDDTDTNEKQKSANVNFHYKPKPTKSKEAYMEQEGDSELPKGVTIRPSGKWVRIFRFCNVLQFTCTKFFLRIEYSIPIPASSNVLRWTITLCWCLRK